MKKMLFSLAAAMMIFAGCDSSNMDIDDLPRTLRISSRTISDTLNSEDDATSWSLTEEGHINVSSGSGSYDGTIGDVSVTPANDSYVRGDTVTATAADDGLVFAYWLLPSRTDSDRDADSTEGNIRYGLSGAGDSISLRTDYEEAEIVGAFAKDGDVFLTGTVAITFTNSGDSSVDYTITLTNTTGGDLTITDPKYRLFDEDGEALDSWKNFIAEDGDLIVATATDSVLNDTINGIEDRTVTGSWNVVIIFKDSSDVVYVVKG